jgi:hypothetical protein
VKFSIRQILASASGAVIAAVIASAFGVKGTIIGVAIGSAAATTGTALVAQSIERGHKAMKQVAERVPDSSTLLRRLGTTGTSNAPDPSASSAPAGPRDAAAETSAMESPAAPVAATERLEVSARAGTPETARVRVSTERVPASRRFSWKTIGGTAAIVFVLALLFVTAVELIAGKPLSSIFGDHGTGTSVNDIFNPSSPPASTTTTTAPATTSTSTTNASSTTTTSSPSTTTTSTTAPPTTTTTAPTGTATTTTTGAAGALSPSAGG